MYRILFANVLAFVFFSCCSEPTGPDLSIKNKFFPDTDESYNVQYTDLNGDISVGKLETKYYKTLPWEFGSPPFGSYIKNKKTYQLHYTTGDFNLSYLITDFENKYYIGYEESDTVSLIGYLSEEEFFNDEVILGDTVLVASYPNRSGETTFLVGIKSLEETYPAVVIYDENFGYFKYNREDEE